MTRRFSRRDFVKTSSAALGAFAIPTTRVRPVQEFDLVVRNGTILDGTGGPMWSGDLGVVGDTIAAIDSIAPERGRRVLDASGLHVSPGFIDIHSHSDSSIFAYPTADSRSRQGITTEVTGQCGFSAAPLEGVDADTRRATLEEETGASVEWTSVSSYFDTLEQIGISVNQAFLLGHGSMRQNVAGLENRHLTEAELASVARSIEEGMDEGAFGLSTGLEYTPGLFTPTEEIVALSRVIARRGGFYASHIRNEESGLLAAIHEAIQIGREARLPVQISHLKAAGRPNWSKQRAALNLIESARRDGVEVMADAYPYTAYSTSLTIFLPPWALEGGWDGLGARLNSPSDRARIRDEVVASVMGDPGEFDLIVIASTKTEGNRHFVGKSVQEVGDAWGVEPAEAALRLLVEEEGAVAMIGHGMSPENVEMVLSHPLVMIGSDGASIAPTGKAAETRPHPRLYGCCPRVLAHYCRDRGIFDLPTAVRKMTGTPADQAGITDRGRISRGKKADLVVFNAATVKDEATFDDPHQYATGINYVVVNGQVVVENGDHTGARPGRVLRKG
jgi:N-acyl-D-amino-acid deacylase